MVNLSSFFDSRSYQLSPTLSFTNSTVTGATPGCLVLGQEAASTATCSLTTGFGAFNTTKAWVGGDLGAVSIYNTSNLAAEYIACVRANCLPSACPGLTPIASWSGVNGTGPAAKIVDSVGDQHLTISHTMPVVNGCSPSPSPSPTGSLTSSLSSTASVSAAPTPTTSTTSSPSSSPLSCRLTCTAALSNTSLSGGCHLPLTSKFAINRLSKLRPPLV